VDVPVDVPATSPDTPQLVYNPFKLPVSPGCSDPTATELDRQVLHVNAGEHHSPPQLISLHLPATLRTSRTVDVPATSPDTPQLVYNPFKLPVSPGCSDPTATKLELQLVALWLHTVTLLYNGLWSIRPETLCRVA
jgi:hypothetical protein